MFATNGEERKIDQASAVAPTCTWVHDNDDVVEPSATDIVDELSSSHWDNFMTPPKRSLPATVGEITKSSAETQQAGMEDTHIYIQ